MAHSLARRRRRFTRLIGPSEHSFAKVVDTYSPKFNVKLSRGSLVRKGDYTAKRLACILVSALAARLATS